MMSEIMQATTASSGRRAAPSAPLRARAALSAEWIKLRSLRSMLVTPALAAVICIGYADFLCWRFTQRWHTFDAANKAGFNPLDTNFNVLVIGVLFFGVLGALVVTNEYGNGLIRTTLAATPQRGLVLAAKTALLVLIALATSAVICFAAFFSGQYMLSSGHAPHVTLTDPGVLGHLLGGVYYLTATGALGLFIGVLARSTAAAMTCVFAVLLVLTILVDKLPHTAVWQHTAPYLPANLGTELYRSHVDGLTSTAVAVVLLPVYAVVLGALAAFALRRRDA